ncbi:uncharacterized protein LOC131003203 isoform X1 [Salvia miltiorrhiza]|uniref:uncharacterized protein LOC131003203 isoform X1 n=1 Tax=Salvia miltiorrhiza TaxID=226208 RepID=UPI0025ACE171|nr:uncharacterized protein LOC131003203 isoform X1 [Salvia miltiorrhiza]
MLTIFKNIGRVFGKNSSRFLQKEEYDAAHLYVLNNCPEVTNTYIGLFFDEIKYKFPRITSNHLHIKFDTEFANWFKSYVRDPNNEIDNIYLRHLSLGPLQRMTCYQGFYVNGFKFQTVEYGSRNKTDNSGICVKGSVLGGVQQDYYGRLLEVVILEYPGLPTKKTTLFKCQWFDPSPTWTFVDREFKLVSINQTHLYNKYEPFVLASKAIQVYYCTYPSKNVTRRNWLAACKVKARSLVEVSSNETSLPFQEELFTQVHHTIIDDDPIPVHPDGGLVDMVEDEDEDGDEDAIHESILETSSSEADDLDDIE